MENATAMKKPMLAVTGRRYVKMYIGTHGQTMSVSLASMGIHTAPKVVCGIQKKFTALTVAMVLRVIGLGGLTATLVLLHKMPMDAWIVKVNGGNFALADSLRRNSRSKREVAGSFSCGVKKGSWGYVYVRNGSTQDKHDGSMGRYIHHWAGAGRTHW